MTAAVKKLLSVVSALYAQTRAVLLREGMAAAGSGCGWDCCGRILLQLGRLERAAAMDYVDERELPTKAVTSCPLAVAGRS